MNTTTPKESRSLWAYVPALLLGSMLAGLGTLAYIATDDPNFALEPNYYDKAVHWDQARAQAQKSAELGFTATATRFEVAPDGSAELELRVEDRACSAVQQAVVRAEAFPNAYAQHVERLTFRETAPGVYRATIARGVAGLWEVRVSVEQGPRRFSTVLRTDARKGNAA